MTRSMLTLVFLGGLTLLVGCSGMSPEAKAELAAQVADLVSKGIISSKQAELILNQGAGWEEVAISIGSAVGSIALSLLGVRAWRGGIQSRKGDIGVRE